MLDAIRAEALKFRRHRATWLMVWIYPVAVTLLVAGLLVYGAFAEPAAAEAAPTAQEWVRGSTTLWRIPTSGPGRLLIAGFVALMFGGEYGWNTWKLVIPARRRWQLIAAKWIVALGLIFAALVVADIVGLVHDVMGGGRIPAGVTLAAVAGAHVRAAAQAVLPIGYAVAFGGMFAVLTRSILATMILSIALVVVEGLLPLIGIFAYARAPALTEALIRSLPPYHVGNLNAWAQGTNAVVPLAPDTMIALSWETSVGVMIAWIVGACAVTQLRFVRQDIN